jgi:hypothetical protein
MKIGCVNGGEDGGAGGGGGMMEARLLDFEKRLLCCQKEIKAVSDLFEERLQVFAIVCSR